MVSFNRRVAPQCASLLKSHINHMITPASGNSATQPIKGAYTTKQLHDSRPSTPYMCSCSSEAGCRGDLLRSNVDAAPPAACGVRRVARRGQAVPDASSGFWQKGHSENTASYSVPPRRGSSAAHCAGIKSGDRNFRELSSLLTVKTLTGMTTDVYPRENCIAPAIVLIVWTTNTKNRCAREG